MLKYTFVNAQKGVSWYHDSEEEVIWPVHKHKPLLRCNQQFLEKQDKIYKYD